MSGTNNANDLGRKSSNAADSVADGIGGVFKEVKGEYRLQVMASVASSTGSMALPAGAIASA